MRNFILFSSLSKSFHRLEIRIALLILLITAITSIIMFSSGNSYYKLTLSISILLCLISSIVLGKEIGKTFFAKKYGVFNLWFSLFPLFLIVLSSISVFQYLEKGDKILYFAIFLIFSSAFFSLIVSVVLFMIRGLRRS